MRTPFKDIIPALTPDEYNQLEANILTDGIREPLILWGDKIVDGHNRYKIALRHNLPYRTAQTEFKDDATVKAWIIKNQFGRRNLTSFQRAELALKLKYIFQEKAKENLSLAGQSYSPREGLQKSAKVTSLIDTREEIAEIAGVSHDTIYKVEKIKKQAPIDVIERINKGDITINRAFLEIKKQDRKESIERQKEEIRSNKIEMPEGKFEIIVIDPPWNYGREYDAMGSRVANPYPEMTLDELRRINIPASENCILWLWATHAFIWDAKELMDYWGFQYKAVLVWNKEKMGMGVWLRMQIEFCLLGIKGSPLWNANDIRDIIHEARREHSRKPDKFYKMIDENFVGRRLDYFSREARPGWRVMGNDTKNF